MIVIRTRKKEKLTQVKARYQMDRKGWIALGVGTIITILLIVFYSLKDMLTEGAVIAILMIQFFVIGLGTWLSLCRNR